MSKQASVSDIAAYLSNVKRLVSTGAFQLIPRKKNLQDLARYGLTIDDAKDEILGLTVVDYYKGPKQDFDPNRPGDIWEFKKNVDGIPFYIKVKIANEGGSVVLKCLGFHEDEFV
ncbi:MAG: type II toxin-antitoxin system MqsR family toxin [Clostridia bacterium]|nr:type II toxin-antitoxin system MqsR family toxin [Clostridia bacterium]